MNRKKHVAIWIGILSLVFILTIYGQVEQTETPQGTEEASLSEAVLSYRGAPDPEELALRALSKEGALGVGLTSINGDRFLRLQLQPDIDFGKVGFGLDIVLLYNFLASEGEDTSPAKDSEAWDGISSILRFVRYGHPSDPFYVRFGELDYVTIGHGFIMSGYSNYDRRGLHLNLSTKRRGIETVISNLSDPAILGGRAFVRPLSKEEGDTSILNSLEFGATYLMDIEPNRIPDDERIPETTDEDPLIALGVDVGAPFINNRLLRLEVYDDVAFLNTKLKADEPGKTGTAIGNAIGLGLSTSNALFKVEYRTFGEGFYPTIFDYTYDAVKGIGSDFLSVAANTDAGKPKRGYFSMLTMRSTKVDFMVVFEDYTTTEPKLYAGITGAGIANRVSLRAFYVKRNIGEPDPGFPEKEGSQDPDFFQDLFRLDSESAFTVRIGYEILPRFEVAIIREYRFHPVEDEAGETRFEPIQKTSVEGGFRLNF